MSWKESFRWLWFRVQKAQRNQYQNMCLISILRILFLIALVRFPMQQLRLNRKSMTDGTKESGSGWKMCDMWKVYASDRSGNRCSQEGRTSEFWWNTWWGDKYLWLSGVQKSIQAIKGGTSLQFSQMQVKKSDLKTERQHLKPFVWQRKTARRRLNFQWRVQAPISMICQFSLMNILG